MSIKYYPNDRRNTGTLGLKLPMNALKSKSNTGVFNTSRTTEEQAVSNYINLLLTRRGERYMQPEFGIGIQEKLFEQNTEFLQSQIELEIQTQSEFWLPYIFNKSIVVSYASDIPTLGGDTEHGIHVTIVFSVTESGANQTIVVFGENGKTNIKLL